MLLLLMAQAAAAQQPLNLTCFGTGVAYVGTSGPVYGHYSGYAGTTPVSGNASGTVYGVQPQGYDDQVDVRLFSGDDRIRLPHAMTKAALLPSGKDGWFKLKNVVADERTISAKATIDFESNPKVRIDRMTGTISISGAVGDYTGQCQVIQADAPRKF